MRTTSRRPSRVPPAFRTARAPAEPLERRVLFTAGDLDITFGAGGFAFLPAGGVVSDDIAVAPDGKVVAAAATGGRYDGWITLGRALPGGAPDLAFGPQNTGTVAAPHIIPPDDVGIFTGARLTGLAVQPDRKVLVAGSEFDEGAGGDEEHPMSVRRVGFVMRFDEDGSLDESFGGGDGIVTGPEGIVTVLEGGPWNTGASPFVGLIVLADGRIVTARDGGSLFRFNPDGTPDASFGGDGRIDLPTPGGGGSFSPNDLAAVGDGSGDVIVLGTLAAPAGSGGGVTTVLARVRPDGALATSFGGGDGLVVEPVNDTQPLFPSPTHMAVTPQGAVVLAGTHRGGGKGWLAVSRYTPAGMLDTSFGRGGADRDGVVSAGAAGTNDRSASDVALLPDGRIVAVGNAGSAFDVVRFSADGRLDPSFAPGGADGDGVARVELPPDPPDPNPDNSHWHVPVQAVAVQPGGNVVAAAGDVTTDGWGFSGNVILARLLADPQVGTRTYQAEQAATSGAAVSRAHPGFTGTGYADYLHAAGDYAEFTVDAPAAGRYELGFRYAHGGTSPRTMDLRVAGTSVAGGVSFAPTGSWHTWTTRAIPVVLAAGRNTVRLAASGQSGPNVDALAVTPLPPPEAVYQAEAARLSGVAAAADQAGYTGAGYADYRHAAGDFVEFSVDAPAGGDYLLGLRYANGGGYDRPLDLSMDGQPATRLSFVPTGAWRTWNSTTRSVLLTAGRHTVRLTATGRSGPNLDALTVQWRQ